MRLGYRGKIKYMRGEGYDKKNKIRRSVERKKIEEKDYGELSRIPGHETGSQSRLTARSLS